MLAGVVLIVAALGLYALVQWGRQMFHRWRLGYPAGPCGLPLIGSVISIGSEPHKAFMEWRRLYGDVFTVPLGNKLVVVINGYEKIRQTLGKKGRLFANRPDLYLLTYMVGKRGILGANHGYNHNQKRRFISTNLNHTQVDFEELVMKEVNYLINHLRRHSETRAKPKCISRTLTSSIGNVICNTLFGRHLVYDNIVHTEFIDLCDDVLKGVQTAGQYHFFPIVRFLPQYKHFFQSCHRLNTTVTSMVDQAMATYSATRKRGMVDIFLENMDNCEPGDDSIYTKDQLIALMKDLIISGFETTSVTLRWAILYMALYPDIQERVHGEVSQLDTSVYPKLSSCTAAIPYTMATLLEIQRFHYIVPLVTRSTICDVKMDGCQIPENTIIFVNLYSCMMDPATWHCPNVFNPDRFLMNNKVIPKEDLIPFSIGKRACPGEQFAKMEMFLFFFNLTRSFKFSLPECEPRPDPSKGTLRGTYQPPSHKIIIENRM